MLSEVPEMLRRTSTISADGAARANAVKPRKSQNTAVVSRSWNAGNSRSLAAAASFTTSGGRKRSGAQAFALAHHAHRPPTILEQALRALDASGRVLRHWSQRVVN